MENKMDWEELANRSVERLDLSGVERAQVLREIRSAEQLAEIFAGPGVTSFESRALQVHLIDNQPGATVRTLAYVPNRPEYVNYNEILMGYNRRGKEVRVRDIYIHASSAWLSELVRASIARRLSPRRTEPPRTLLTPHRNHLRRREYKEAVSYLDERQKGIYTPFHTLEAMMRERSTPDADYEALMQSLEYRRWKRDVEKR